jgi:hypothetical protein
MIAFQKTLANNELNRKSVSWKAGDALFEGAISEARSHLEFLEAQHATFSKEYGATK